jgi:hypothetical protein
MMKLALRLCALWVCGPLALGASATESAAQGASSKAGRPAVQESTHLHVDSGKGGGSKGRNAAVAVSPRRDAVTAPHAVGSLVRNNADRLRSLHLAKARGRIAPASSRSVGPDRAAATGNLAARAQGLRGATRVGLPALPVSQNAARVPSSVKAAAIRGPIIGGPRAAGPGRVGGPAIGRPAQNTAIDGAHMRRKF